jgi:hypothetical protein
MDRLSIVIHKTGYIPVAWNRNVVMDGGLGRRWKEVAMAYFKISHNLVREPEDYHEYSQT